MFAWGHSELKRVDPSLCQHHIQLKVDVKLVRLHRYKISPNYANKVNEEIDSLLKLNLFAEIESSRLFPIVVLKKNGKLRVCRLQEAECLDNKLSISITLQRHDA